MRVVSSYIYLSGYGFSAFVKHDVICRVTSEKVNTNDARRDFHDRLFSSGFQHYRINFDDKITTTSKIFVHGKILKVEKPENSI